MIPLGSFLSYSINFTRVGNETEIQVKKTAEE